MQGIELVAVNLSWLREDTERAERLISFSLVILIVLLSRCQVILPLSLPSQSAHKPSCLPLAPTPKYLQGRRLYPPR